MIPFTSHAVTPHTSIIEEVVLYLERTIAEIVRGNNVTIGPGGVISVVDYHTSFKQKGTAFVT